MKLRLLLAVVVCICLSAFAVEGVAVSGEAMYFSPYSESPAEARRNAINEAKMQALSKEFGMSVTQHSSMVETEATTNFYCLGECDVNGEWLQDISEAEVRTEPADNGTYYFAKVRGKARRIPNNRVALDCRLLYNGTDPDRNGVRNNAFRQGDEFYLYFMSPVDGYLAVYLGDDDEAQTFQALIPYDGQKEPSYPIKAGHEYIFFSKATAEPQYVGCATRMIMEARKEVDNNVLYVVFSPNEFSGVGTTKSRAPGSMVSKGGQDYNLMPRETTFRSFHKWLAGKRTHDADMQIIKEIITIEGNK